MGQPLSGKTAVNVLSHASEAGPPKNCLGSGPIDGVKNRAFRSLMAGNLSLCATRVGHISYIKFGCRNL